jgi:hypothetical protein
MSKRPRPPYSALTPAQRGAITRRARAEGKDPARVHAALKGVQTRAANRYREAVRHGKSAREKTEKSIAAGKFRSRAQRARRLAEKAARPTERRPALGRSREPESPAAEPLTLKTLSRYRRREDDYEIEIEGHHEVDGDT